MILFGSIKGYGSDHRGPSRKAYVLRLVRDIDRYMIEEEIAIRVARHVNDPQAEAGVVEVAGAPRAAPGIGWAAKIVAGFGCAEGRGRSGCRPGDAAIPRELHADLWRSACPIGARIETHLNTPDHGRGRQVEIVVVVVVFILATICAGGAFVRAAVCIGCSQ